MDTLQEEPECEGMREGWVGPLRGRGSEWLMRSDNLQTKEMVSECANESRKLRWVLSVCRGAAAQSLQEGREGSNFDANTVMAEIFKIT